MRSGWTRDAHQLIFDVGPLSSPKSGHGHADLLAIQCTVFGEAYIVDPGTYCYTAEPAWRDFFRGTAAHSTVTVDGEGQAFPAARDVCARLASAEVRFADRAGGYTRIIHAGFRIGDGADLAILELIGSKLKKKVKKERGSEKPEAKENEKESTAKS